MLLSAEAMRSFAEQVANDTLDAMGVTGEDREEFRQILIETTIERLQKEMALK